MEQRDNKVLQVLVIEGLANLIVLGIKLLVGVSTGSLAVLADAVHSLTDVSNNVVAWFVTRHSVKPADSKHRRVRARVTARGPRLRAGRARPYPG